MNKKMHTISSTSVEGSDHINVSKHSNTEIGKKLSYGYPINIDTVFGKVGTVRSVMDFLVTPNYPKALLGKPKLTPSDIKKIPKRKTYLDNYWAIIAYVLCLRVLSDESLIKLLKANKLPYTSYNISKSKYFAQETEVIEFNNKMYNYIDLINGIQTLIQEDKFNDDSIKDFVFSKMKNKEISLFEGIINVVIK